MSESRKKKNKIEEKEEEEFLNIIRQQYIEGKDEEFLNRLYNPDLVKKAVLPVKRAWLKAVKEGDVTQVKEMLRYISPNIIETESGTGFSALIVATLYDFDHDLEIIQILLDDPRTDPNIQSKQRAATALMISSLAGNIKKLKAILSHGKTDPNIQDIDGNAALMFAAHRGDIKIVEAILSHPRTNPIIRDKKGKTAIAYCDSKECGSLFERAYLFTHLRKNEAMKGLMKHQVAGKELPALPADVWRLIIQKKIQSEICADLSDNVRDKGKLISLARYTMNVPENVALEWETTKSKKEVCEILSELISIGAMYSEQGMDFLKRRKESAQAVGTLEKFTAELDGLGIDKYYYDKDGIKRWKPIEQILDELNFIQKSISK